MRPPKGRRLRSALGATLIAAPVIGLLGTALSDPIDAQQQGQVPEHDHNDHDHGLAYTPMGLQFPPQPADLEDVRWHGNGAMVAAADRHAGQVTAMEATAEMRRALGSRFERISTQPIVEKGEAADGSVLVTYVSHANNRVVTAVVRNGTLISADSAMPKDYQPPLGPGEVDEAIRLATESYHADGVRRVDDLEAYAILALPTTEGVAFHNHRVVYVTFTETADVRPELGAYVDLTDLTIMRKVGL